MAARSWTRALVTGASSGIGRTLAEQLAGLGANLVLTARSEAVLRELAEQLEEQHGIDAEVLPADLTEDDDLARVAERLTTGDDPVDLVVNNAGFGNVGRFDRLDVDSEERQIRLNVRAVVRLSHAPLTRMVAAGHGGILNVASLAAFQPVPYFATYAASKAFVSSFTQSLHEELLGTGVHATVLCPGFARTNFPNAAGLDESETGIPDIAWMDPRPVAKAGLDAVTSNRAVVVPGLAYKAVAALSTVTPSAITRRIARLAQRR